MTEHQPLPIVVIACEIFEDMLKQHLPEDVTEQVTFLEYGLHRVPQKIANTVQFHLDQLQTPSLVVLGYGLCGNGIKGVRSGKHTLLVPRMDDCIAMLLGSRGAYLREFDAVPGTYWLSKGWLESGSHPLKEYQTYSEKYGTEEAEWLMDTQYQHYERLVLVTHTQDDMEQYRTEAKSVAKFCERWDFGYEEILGSDRFVKRLAEVAQDLSKADKEFVIIPPGGEIRMEQFF